MRISVADAKNRFAELLKAVEAGETVTICRRGVPIVDLIRTAANEKPKPKFGTLRGKIQIHDPNWWKAMTDDEVESFLEKGYY